MTRSTKNENKQSFADMFHELEQTGDLYVEWAKIGIAEQIYSAMKRQEVSRADLARRLGKSRAYVTQILQGDANFTVESLVKISRALGCDFEMKLNPKQSRAYWECVRRPSAEGRVLPWPVRTSAIATNVEARVEGSDASEPLAA